MQIIFDDVKSVREVARVKNLSKSALSRHVIKVFSSKDRDSVIFQSNLTCGMVFLKHEESTLKDLMLTTSRMHYGLTAFQARTLAYEYAGALMIKIPHS